MSKTAESVWNNCLSFIEDNITSQAYKTWFEPIKAVKLTDNALNVQVPSKFFYEWLEEHYVKILKEKIEQGMPVLGICAGMVLLSNNANDKVVGKIDQPLLNILDIKLERNSFGRQRQSFESNIKHLLEVSNRKVF